MPEAPEAGNVEDAAASDAFQPGASPGTLTAPPGALPPVIDVIAFGPDSFQQELDITVDRLGELQHKHPLMWINFAGLGDVGKIEKLGGLFGMHRLALEDALSSHQRAKVEPYQDRLFAVARMVELDEGKVKTEQLSLWIGPGFVVSFQEYPGDCFDPVRERIRMPEARIRSQGPDYLAYALLDAVVDFYFPVVEELGDDLEALEEAVLADPASTSVSRLHRKKRNLLALRRAIWPLRDALTQLRRDPLGIIKEDTRVYLRDCEDHAIRLIDVLETYRERASGLFDLYLSSMSHRMNEVMKVLTIIATIFIPLSFIAGLYGMNFDPEASPLNMPELSWYFGYPFALTMMALLTIALLYFFYRKGWLTGSFEIWDDEEAT